jgi:hypothetical protein
MRLIFALITCAALTFSSAYADEEVPSEPAVVVEQPASEERAPVNTRSLNDEERLQLFEIQETTEPAEQAQRSLRGAKSLGGASKRTKGLGWYSTCYPSSPYSAHYAVDISWDSALITLEDSSVLYVATPYQYQVARWPLNSQVYIVPNHGYFLGLIRSSYDFCLYNATTGDTVECNLHLGPALFGPYSEWLTGIDGYNGYLWLKDGRLVEVHPNDVYLLWNWAPNDHTLVGVNDGSGSCSYPDIILNVATVTYVRARLVY